MGFSIAEGPEIELSEYNFTKLNTKQGHPARDWQDTFYITEDEVVMLRAQTSPVQVRTMETRPLPIRVIAPGRVYRKDEVGRHTLPMFHQIEGLVVDKGITMAGPQGHAGNIGAAAVWGEFRRALPPAPLSLYGAFLRNGCSVLRMPRRGLPRLQG